MEKIVQLTVPEILDEKYPDYCTQCHYGGKESIVCEDCRWKPYDYYCEEWHRTQFWDKKEAEEEMMGI